MPALQLADSPMHSSPHYTHFNIHTHGSSPLSSPPSPISYNGSTSSPIAAHTDGDHHPPDLTCTLRFGDIPASSFGTGARSGTMQTPAPLHLLGSSSLAPADSGCGSKGEVKLLNRSQSKLGKRSTSPMRGISRDHEAVGSDGVPVPAAHTEAPCCAATTGLCSSANCMVGSPGLPEAFLALQKFLPSNNLADDEDDDEEIWSATDSWPALDVYSCDDFRMFEFKVRKCVRGRSHDWTECPFAHPGEKARRRDPRRYRYSGTACPDFRKGNCRRGEACEYSHGVFECWLHPTRYRTQPCKDGKGCRRRVCFFAHTPEQLRVVPAEGESPPTTPGSGSSSGGSARSSLLKAAALSGGAYDGSPLRRALAGTLDGTVALELFLDDVSNKNAAAAGACHHHHHHHWIGMGSSPSSTLVGLSAGATSPSPMSSPVISPASPLISSAIPAHRRHLDRLRSIPTLSIPTADDATGSPPQGSPCTMSELMSTLQTLQVSPSAMSIQSCRTLPSVSSAWPLISQLSAPNTPNPRYMHPMNMMQINPAERALSSTYVMKPAGAITAGSGIATATGSVATAGAEMQPGVESEAPDLGWVNELVQ